MTSMPASRRARAITLAPRSWPSRPGLATSTRIFLSVGTVSRIHQGLLPRRFRPWLLLCRCGTFARLVQAAPQIPASDGAMRMPRLGQLFDGLGVRHLLFAICLLDGRADAEVAGGQHVAAA